MEFLDKIGEFFSTLIAAVERGITRLFGASNDRMIRRIGFVRRGDQTTITPGTLLDRINKLEGSLQQLSDDELKQTASKLRARLKAGETLDDLIVDAFASVREAGRRFLKMRHYDTQMIGGYVLHRGMIAEMVTGEGKTLVATLPAFLNALSGKVHVVTVNDYLARRDMEWMAPLYMGLGLTVGAIQSSQQVQEKTAAYACDITYGTNNEFGFDYLRDNMKLTADQQTQGRLDFAIVDEIDNILVDEARTPLIISGPANDDPEKYRKANSIAMQLRKDVHFEVKEKEHSCHLTEDGVRFAEEVAGVESFYTTGNMEWPHLIDNSLRAHHLYKRDVNYVVMQGEIVIVDEFTGRLMKGRQWSDGLHQAVEAKEGVKIKEENQTLATITLQNFFKLYKKLGGMTGTAMTEASEFWKIYHLDVVAVPSNRPMKRINHPDVIFRSVKEKYSAVADEIAEVHKSGRPILVGTTSIENSEHLSQMLIRRGVKHEVLNAKHHEREAEIIAQAGRLSAVTIATNMAGRGTDIILGGNPDAVAWEELKTKYRTRIDVPKNEWDEVADRISDEQGMKEQGRRVAELGGLHVIGTERHEARRIDLQLRGRSGRQGDPGSSRFFLSLEDDLMRIFAGDWVKDMLTRLGMQEGEAIESGLVSGRIQAAQKRVEERNFETRKNLLEYDEVMDVQRRRVYGYRQAILDGNNCRNLITRMLESQVHDAARDMLSGEYGRQTAVQFAVHELGLEVKDKDLRGRNASEVIEFLKEEGNRQAEDLIRDRIDEDLPPEAESEREWNWQSLSKWANGRWGLNTNDRELRKLGRDGVAEELYTRAKSAIERSDLSAVETFLAEDYGAKSFSSWLHQKFGLGLNFDRFMTRSIDESIVIVGEELQKLYLQKEIEFPVTVGLSSFLTSGGNSSPVNDRDGLVQWARNRFAVELDLEAIRNGSRQDVYETLMACSRNFYKADVATRELDSEFAATFGPGATSDEQRIVNSPDTVQKLVEWGNRTANAGLTVEELDGQSSASIYHRLLRAIDERFRPELAQAERLLILELLDTAWKDHLYYMDQLRQGIGLVGYAQKDPKVEYKREGMRAFEAMWKQIADNVTNAIFRLEDANPDFLGSLWQITSVSHAAPVSAVEYVEESRTPDTAGDTRMQTSSGPNTATAVEPIRNFGEKVGRNDPCPCGSGKKYKNCHGQQ